MSAERRGWALVTGASAGIGAEVALRLARRGHPLVIVARRGDRLAALAEQARREHGVEVRGVAADLSREEGRVAVRGVLDQLRGPLEVAVLNAGIGTQGPFVDLDRAAEVREVRLNCVAVVDLASHVLPGMVANGRGDLVVMSSAAASQAIPYMSTYAATKAFEMRFVRGIDQELRGTGVRAFAICPGPVRTAFHRLGWGRTSRRSCPRSRPAPWPRGWSACSIAVGAIPWWPAGPSRRSPFRSPGCWAKPSLRGERGSITAHGTDTPRPDARRCRPVTRRMTTRRP